MPGCEPLQGGGGGISRRAYSAHLEVEGEGLVCLDVRVYRARDSISRRANVAHLEVEAHYGDLLRVRPGRLAKPAQREEEVLEGIARVLLQERPLVHLQGGRGGERGGGQGKRASGGECVARRPGGSTRETRK